MLCSKGWEKFKEHLKPGDAVNNVNVRGATP